ILSDDYVDADDYTETWDGTDEDGDYVESGSYDVVIRADNVAITKVVNVEYSKPTINEVFVTKTSFDTSKEEVVSLAFKVEAEAEMTVDLYNGSKKEFTLVKDEEVRKNRWYYVEWDGLDNEGDEAIAGNAWKFKISAKNSTDDEIFDSKFVEIDVADDDVSTGKANVTNDAVAPVVFDSDTEESLDLSYCIDDTAEVYIAVYEGLSTSGNAEVELLDYEEQDSGCHTVTWDGTDEDGKILSDGTYSYKIISKIGSKKDTETGRFVFGTKGGARVVPNPEPNPNPETSDCGDLYRDLGTMKDSEMCNAIVWASENGVFQGYNDGTFKPYAPINRAETLKVVLESNGATILPSAGSNLGFTDVDANAWYMPYIRTAKFYGIFSGHSDGRAAANDVVTRVEFLKIALESYKALNGLNLEGYFSDYADVDYTQWYAKYLGAAYEYNLFNTNEFGGRTYLDPTRALNRGEAALLLYKLEQQNQARI
ncbi:MAG: S-layer homology domain-containing protein, partial [Candidatus Gracilibacteria bacterium]